MSDSPTVNSTRRRITLTVVAAVTLGIGLVVHLGVSGMIGDIVGDALYAVLIYVLVAFLAPRRPRPAIAVAAFVFCAAVELLQLTGLPASGQPCSRRSVSSSARASMSATSRCTPARSPWRPSSTWSSPAHPPVPGPRTPQGALPKESALCEEMLTQPTSVR